MEASSSILIPSSLIRIPKEDDHAPRNQLPSRSEPIENSFRSPFINYRRDCVITVSPPPTTLVKGGI